MSNVAVAGRPWATVIAAAVAALVAAGALVAAVQVRDRARPAPPPVATPPATSGVGPDGCLIQPCQVLRSMPVAGTRVDLVADKGGRSGRLRIGGGGSSKVIEATITSMGVVLTADSLQCVPGSLSVCLLHGPYPDGVAAQVIVGRSTNWNDLTLFLSDAGYLGLAQVMDGIDVEVLVARHRCAEPAGGDCAGTPVYLGVYSLDGEELGCSRDYPRLEALPGWPAVALQSSSVKPCA